jgi:hypothetical protein
MSHRWNERRASLVILALGGALGSCSAAPIDVATLAPDSLAEDQVAHWRFDDALGDTARDSSGNGRDGTVAGATWGWVDGRFGGALHFVGGDQVTVPAFPQPTRSYSVAAWLRVEMLDVDFDNPSPTLVTTETPLVGGWSMNAIVGPPPGNYAFVYYGGTGTVDVAAECACFDVGPWVHLVGVVDSETASATLYVNGKARERVSPAPAIPPGDRTLRMGRSSTQARLLTGALDDVVIYARALVPEEITRLGMAAAPDPR